MTIRSAESQCIFAQIFLVPQFALFLTQLNGGFDQTHRHLAPFGLRFRVLMTGTMEPFDDRPNGSTLGSG